MSGDACRPNHNSKTVLQQKEFREREIFLRPRPVTFSIRRLSRLPDSNKLSEKQLPALPPELLGGEKRVKPSHKLYLPILILCLILVLAVYAFSRESSEGESAQTQKIGNSTTETSIVENQLELNFAELRTTVSNTSRNISIENTSTEISESADSIAVRLTTGSQSIEPMVEAEVVDGAYLIYPSLSEAEIELLREQFIRDLTERSDLVGVVLREASAETWDLILLFPPDEFAELELQELAVGIVQAVICGSKLYYLDTEANLRVFDSIEQNRELKAEILADNVRTFSLEIEDNNVYLYMVDKAGKFRKIEQ